MAKHKGARVIGIDLVPERIIRARANGIEVLDLSDHDDIAESLRELTDGRGPDSMIDAVGMEAHGAKIGEAAQKLVGLIPDAIAAKMMEKAGVDRLVVSTRRSRRSAAAARSRCRASTAAWSIRCR